MNLAELDKKVNFDQLEKDIQESKENGGTGNFPELPKGYYIVVIEKLELGETKDHRPMVKWQFRTVDAATTEDLESSGVDTNKLDNAEALHFFDTFKGKKKPLLFMNRVIYGTKNDGNMIQSVIGWMEKLECDFPIVFKGYQDFSELIMDVAEDIDGVEMLVFYDKDAFNNVSIIEVYGD